MRAMIGFLAAWLPMVPLSAQDSALVTPGTRVRVTAESALVQLPAGTYRTLTDTTLVATGSFQGFTDTALALSSGTSSFAIPVASIVRLERSEGRRVVAAARVLGFVIGAAAGVALGCLGNRDSYGAPCLGENDAPFVMGFAIGGTAGAVWLAKLFRVEQWSVIQDDQLSPLRP